MENRNSKIETGKSKFENRKPVRNPGFESGVSILAEG
jgi:hypothetical protein